MRRALLTAGAVALGLAASVAQADTVGGRTQASPLPGECRAPGRTTVYRPLPGGGYRAMTIDCPAGRTGATGKTPEDRLLEVSGATNMERLKSLTLQPPGTRDNSMGRSTPP
jgi:hypothetical protein